MHKKIRLNLFCFWQYIVLLIIYTHGINAYAKQQQPDTIPYFLKNQSKLYAKSPKKAALAWYSEARMGLFIHWGVWGKYHAAWAMFNQKIPFEDYKKRLDSPKY